MLFCVSMNVMAGQAAPTINRNTFFTSVVNIMKFVIINAFCKLQRVKVTCDNYRQASNGTSAVYIDTDRNTNDVFKNCNIAQVIS